MLSFVLHVQFPSPLKSVRTFEGVGGRQVCFLHAAPPSVALTAARATKGCQATVRPSDRPTSTGARRGRWAWRAGAGAGGGGGGGVGGGAENWNVQMFDCHLPPSTGHT